MAVEPQTSEVTTPPWSWELVMMPNLGRTNELSSSMVIRGQLGQGEGEREAWWGSGRGGDGTTAGQWRILGQQRQGHCHRRWRSGVG